MSDEECVDSSASLDVFETSVTQIPLIVLQKVKHDFFPSKNKSKANLGENWIWDTAPLDISLSGFKRSFDQRKVVVVGELWIVYHILAKD